MIPTSKLIIIILVASLSTFATRIIPFAIFTNREVPKIVKYLGDILPPAIIGILIIYCIKSAYLGGSGAAFSIDINSLIPQIIGIAITSAIHLWKKNTLLSISIGTVSYMLLIHFVF